MACVDAAMIALCCSGININKDIGCLEHSAVQNLAGWRLRRGPYGTCLLHLPDRGRMLMVLQ